MGPSHYARHGNCRGVEVSGRTGIGSVFSECFRGYLFILWRRFDIIGSVKTRGFGGYLISRWATHFLDFIGTFVLTPRWPRASVW